MSGTITSTRRVYLGVNEYEELSAKLGYAVDEAMDYLVAKGIIDQTADLAVEVVTSRLFRKASPIVVSDRTTPGHAERAWNVHQADARLDEPVEKVSPPVLAPVTVEALVAAVDADLKGLDFDVDLPAESDDPSKLSREFVETNPVFKEIDDQIVEEFNNTAIISADDQELALDAELDAALAETPRVVPNDELYNKAHHYIQTGEKKGVQVRMSALRELMAKFTNSPQVAKIPADRRLDFLTQLEGLPA
jgi:hypothetical protein